MIPAPSTPARGSILLRPKRPAAGRINEESIEKEWQHEQDVLRLKAAQRAEAERERERWGHIHEFDREEMHARLQSQRDQALALKEAAEREQKARDRELDLLPGNFDFDAKVRENAQRREETRRAMEDNARLMRQKLEAAREAKLDDITTEAARGDEFIGRFSKPAWREQVKQAPPGGGRAAVLGGVVRPACEAARHGCAVARGRLPTAFCA